VYPAGRYYDTDDSIDADVQRALRRRGYYHGPIDGDIGPGSRSAIREYQADHGLRMTGRIDGSLIRSLGL
jgi:peptidoglycan hydrolase-like protein with peptidoglycan-binding domain